MPTRSGDEIAADCRESLYSRLWRLDLSAPDLDEQLARLARQYGDTVYSELIHRVSHLLFEVEDARRHWEAISQHRAFMQRRLEAPVDLRVALASYFLHVSPNFEDPRIIESSLLEETRASVYRDELTGLYNYRFFRETLDREVERHARHNAPLSLLMVDVDDFKSYNDACGHQAGHTALTSIADAISGSLRTTDIAARFGGEELAVILPSTPKAGAQKVAERMRNFVEGAGIVHPSRPEGGSLTVSIGVATFPADASAGGELIQRADQALYQAKADGKNGVWLYGKSLRSYRRVRKSITGSLRPLSSELFALKTITVSDGGVLFSTNCSVERGTLVELRLHLPDSEQAVTFVGKVVHQTKGRDGTIEAAMKTVEISPIDRRRLLEHLAHCG
ncbi:MAG: diguanylate cyclase [Acidobacteriota bacterium]|nr:MAG: diguanylate cyclase [Acidobacteriota bacterium]